MFSDAKIWVNKIKDKFVFYFRRRKKQPAQLSEDARLRFEKLQQDPGAFEYEAEGFSYPFESGATLTLWADVDRIVGYKLDLFTVDEICVELHVGDRAIRFSESTPGWYRFLARLQEKFPMIPKGWDLTIMQPLSTPNYTFLYERDGGRLPARYNFYGSIRPAAFSLVCEAFTKEGWTLRTGYAGQTEVRNSWSNITISRDNKGVVFTGRIAFRPGVAEAIDRVLYATGGKFKYEFYGEDKEVLLQKRWP